MKVLLDEDLPHRLRTVITGHEVSTVAYLGWKGLKNGELLRTAEEAGIEVLVTADRNLSYQQNLKERHIALVVLTTLDWHILHPHIERITAAIHQASPGSFQLVDCGKFTR